MSYVPESIREHEQQKLLEERYRFTFSGDQGRAVLKHLGLFCHADSVPIAINPLSGAIDPYASAIAAGRLEVWFEIKRMLGRDDVTEFNLLEK
jgi:hypothetical protein